MNQYRSIYPGFWTGKTGREIKGKGKDCQILALYLITCSHSHATGLFYLPLCFMGHETGLDDSAVEAALEALKKIDFCAYDPLSDWIFIKNMVRHQMGPELQPGDRRIKWMETALEEAGKAAPGLTREFLNKYKKPYNLFLNQKPPSGKKRAPIKKKKEPIILFDTKYPQEEPEGPPRELQVKTEGASKGHQKKTEGASKGLQVKTEGPPGTVYSIQDTDTDTEKENIGPEPKKASGPIVQNWTDKVQEEIRNKTFIEILTNKKNQAYPVPEKDVLELSQLFPAVDVKQELREMLSWSKANPRRRKTFNGMPGFIHKWLAKEQDKGGNGPRAPDEPPDPEKDPDPRFRKIKTQEEFDDFEAEGEKQRQQTQEMIQGLREKHRMAREAHP